MLTYGLTYNDLDLDLAEVYMQMGYGGSAPDDDVETEVRSVENDIAMIARPRYCFFTTEGTLDTVNDTLSVNGTEMNLGRIISRQLRGSETFAFFVATAGAEFEDYQMRLKDEDDMVRTFIADSFGSVIAERTADIMEQALQDAITADGLRHTNRFSPGYCGWHVREQPALFALFPASAPCGISLTDSCLMIPIKSVSGVIGLGPDVRHQDYSCGLCSYEQCYKRKRKPTRT